MKTVVDSIRLLLANGDASEPFHSLSAKLYRVVLVAACLRGSALLRANGRAHLMKDEGGKRGNECPMHEMFSLPGVTSLNRWTRANTARVDHTYENKEHTPFSSGALWANGSCLLGKTS